MRKILLIAMLVNSTLVSSSALACRIRSSADDAHEIKARVVQQARTDALALKDEADMVFVGRLAQLTFHIEQRSNDRGEERVVQVHQARFDLIDNIKGSYQEGRELLYTIDKGRVSIGCTTSIKDQSVPFENGAGNRYLVYVKKGIVLRTNQLPPQPQPLSAIDELLVLRPPFPSR